MVTNLICTSVPRLRSICSTTCFLLLLMMFFVVAEVVVVADGVVSGDNNINNSNSNFNVDDSSVLSIGLCPTLLV